ncbi:MAG: hypothetical protein NT170_04420 [Candidatus Moranbacteria bacterium]|nr:hypothetical protein [Candidatus Moranbacteria bacterium]
MKNFLNNIAAFLALLFVSANDEARRVRNAFVTSIISVTLVYLTQLIFDSPSSTIVIAIICDIVVVYAWFNVRRIVFMAGSGETIEILGITTHPGSAEAIGRTEVPKLNILFDLYIATALYALFWMHVVCFFAPLLSLREYPWFGFFLLIGGTAYLIMYPKGAFLRKTLVWGIIIALILMFLRLISPAGWIKFVGADPFGAMRTSIADKALAKALKADKEAADKKVTARLDEITEKRNRGEELSEADKKFLEERKGKGLIRETLGGMFVPSADAKIPPPEKSPAPQATAPKRELRKQTMRFPLDFFTGEKVLNQGGSVEIQNGGYAVFRYSDLPWQKDAKYYIVFSIVRKKTGKHHFEVNDSRGGTFFLDHYASERVETCVFNFDSPGQSQFFHPGDNRFKISSPGDNILIQHAFVQVEYWM